MPVVTPPGGPVQLSAAKAAALQEINTALDGLQQAQQGGDFSQYGEALQRLDDAVKKYQSASLDPSLRVGPWARDADFSRERIHVRW